MFGNPRLLGGNSYHNQDHHHSAQANTREYLYFDETRSVALEVHEMFKQDDYGVGIPEHKFTVTIANPDKTSPYIGVQFELIRTDIDYRQALWGKEAMEEGYIPDHAFKELEMRISLISRADATIKHKGMAAIREQYPAFGKEMENGREPFEMAAEDGEFIKGKTGVANPVTRTLIALGYRDGKGFVRGNLHGKDRSKNLGQLINEVMGGIEHSGIIANDANIGGAIASKLQSYIKKIPNMDMPDKKLIEVAAEERVKPPLENGLGQ